MYIRVAKEVGFVKPLTEWTEADFEAMRSFAAAMAIEAEEMEVRRSG